MGLCVGHSGSVGIRVLMYDVRRVLQNQNFTYVHTTEATRLEDGMEKRNHKAQFTWFFYSYELFYQRSSAASGFIQTLPDDPRQTPRTSRLVGALTNPPSGWLVARIPVVVTTDHRPSAASSCWFERFREMFLYKIAVRSLDIFYPSQYKFGWKKGSWSMK